MLEVVKKRSTTLRKAAWQYENEGLRNNPHWKAQNKNWIFFENVRAQINKASHNLLPTASHFIPLPNINLERQTELHSEL